MIIVKFFAGLIIIITLGFAVAGQFYEPYNPNAVMEQTDVQAVVGNNDAPVQVERRRGAVVCKFDPVTDSPQQFAADYLFGELYREGDIYTFSARVAVPSGGYTVSFGTMSLVGTQVILEAFLNKPNGMALEMIDTVGIQRSVRLPAEALTLRVVLRRNFAWGPDSIICSVMRPAVIAPPSTPVPAPTAPVAPVTTAPVAPAPATTTP